MMELIPRPLLPASGIFDLKREGVISPRDFEYVAELINPNLSLEKH
jgi:hypothetical protein